MQTTASRPRQNRTSTILLAVGAAVLAAGVVVLVLKLTSGNSSTNNQQAAPTPVPKTAQQQEPKTPVQPNGKPVDPHIAYSALPADLRASITKFVMTAVVRRNVASSWDVTTPGLRQGMTKKQWATGNIPPQPFPVYKFNKSKFHVHAKTPNEVGVYITIGATPKSGLKTTTFDIGVHKFGTPPHVHWKVDYWMPYYTPSMPMAGNGGAGGA